MTKTLASGLAVALALLGADLAAQETQWRPAAPRAVAPPPPALPAATLGRPVALTGAASLGPPLATPYRDTQLLPASFTGGATLAPPAPVVRGSSPDPARPLPPGTPAATETLPYPTPLTPPAPTPVTSFAPTSVIPATPGEAYNNGVVTEPAPCTPIGGPALIGPGGGSVCDPSCGPRTWLQSDHCFDGFVSPITNPFLFEDPRALTEIRPIFIYQDVTGHSPMLRGGSMEFFGTQLRLAITDRWSFVINKLGGIAIQPRDGMPPFQNADGLSELWMGPKWTFLRNESTGSVAATGLIFQIPSGPAKVFQDTGTLSLTPYISYAQSFCRSSYGTFNFMGTTGVSFSVDDKRSDYYYLSLHLDYDVANLHKIYPMLEMHYFTDFTNGKARDNVNFEGRDLINFGSMSGSGSDSLSMAAGVRYKFSENIQTGIAVEFPLVRHNDMLDFRITADIIFRY